MYDSSLESEDSSLESEDSSLEKMKILLLKTVVLCDRHVGRRAHLYDSVSTCGEFCITNDELSNENDEFYIKLC